MRYEDWDVILFRISKDLKIPFKEFKVACHVVPDNELSHTHGFVGVPVMTCFVPSLLAGAPFQISIHCWEPPDISQCALNYSGHPELINFEARIIIDGRPVACTVFGREVNGPHLLTHSFEPSKTGEPDRLRFPHFRRELLFQSHWDPGDDLGRVKVIISEGFSHNLTSLPIERVKNVVVFSFQHAPLEVLESNGIAWPSPSMWRRSPLNPTTSVPTYRPSDSGSSHAHSPQKKTTRERNKLQSFQFPLVAGNVVTQQPTGGIIGGQPHGLPYTSRANMTTSSSPSFPYPFPAYHDWMMGSFPDTQQTAECSFGGPLWPGTMRNPGKHCRSDTSMPDYSSSNSVEAMHVSGASLDGGLSVPTNTPTSATPWNVPETSLSLTPSFCLPTDQPTPLTHSLLNQPVPVPMQPISPTFPSPTKPPRENRYFNMADSNLPPTHFTPLAVQEEARSIWHPMFNMGAMTGPESNPAHSISTGGHSGCKTGPSPSPLPGFSVDGSSDSSAKGINPDAVNPNKRQDLPRSPLATALHCLDRLETSETSPTLPLHGSIQITVASRDFTEPVAKTVYAREEGLGKSSPCVKAGGYEV